VPDHQRDSVVFAGVVRNLATANEPLTADLERLQLVHGEHLYRKLAVSIHDSLIVPRSAVGYDGGALDNAFSCFAGMRVRRAIDSLLALDGVAAG
jgi:hypothetical protein